MRLFFIKSRIKVIRIRDIIKLIEEFAPAVWSEEWDNVGLQVGSVGKPVDSVFIAVDPSSSVLARAVKSGSQLLITHHPFLFHPLRRLDLESPLGRMTSFLIQNNLSVYSAHTNLDTIPDGVSTALAKRLGLDVVDVLKDSNRASFCQLSVFLPQGLEKELGRALGDWSKRWIKYRLYYLEDMMSSAPAAPFGSREERTLHSADRVARMDLTIPCSELSDLLDDIRSLYGNTIDFDLYPMKNKPVPVGYGCLAELNRRITFDHFVAFLKEQLGIPYVQMAGTVPAAVNKIAICGGSGSGFLEEAHRAGADILITSEVKHSQARLCEELGFCVLDIGHFHSERFGMMALAGYIRERLQETKLDVKVLEDQEERGPLKLVAF